MTVEWKHLGGHGGRPSTSIEVKVSDWGGGSSISEDVTDMHGKVEIELIQSLRQLANDLEEQNQKVEELCD